MPQTRGTNRNSNRDRGDTENHIKALLHRPKTKVLMPSSSDPIKRNTSRTKKMTPVEVKNEAEGETTYEHGDISFEAIEKVHRDRGKSSLARAKTSSKIDHGEKSEAELRKELTQRVKTANKAELTEILRSMDRILADEAVRVLSVHKTSSKTDAISTRSAFSQSKHRDDDRPKQHTITYEKLTVERLKKMALERGIDVKKLRAKATLVTALEAADRENKENIPPGTDKASKKDVDLCKPPKGRTKRLKMTTKEPSVRTTSSSPKSKAHPALSQPKSQYHCDKCSIPSASEKLHKDPATGVAYYAYLRYENGTSNKIYRLQVTRSGTEDLYHVRTHSGRYGTSNPSCRSCDFITPEDAIKEFRRLFREKSSLDWDNRNMEPKKKNGDRKKAIYNYITLEDESSEDAEHRKVRFSKQSQSPPGDLVDNNLSQAGTPRESVEAPSGGSNNDRGVIPTLTKSRTRAGTRTPNPRKGLKS